MRLNLTTTSVRLKCLPPVAEEMTSTGGQVVQRVFWDIKEPGLGLVVRRPRKGQTSLNASFVYQRDVVGRTRKITIGRYGTWTIEQARKRARELRQEMDKGLDPRSATATLRQAMKMHVEAMRAKGCVERSIGMVGYDLNHKLSDWMDRPLARITRDDCARRHQLITKNSGPYAANRTFWIFRACFNSADRRLDGLPRNPVRGVTFNKMRRRREPIPWEELPIWWAKIHTLRPVRRDLNIFILFTGLRSTDAKTVRWEHVDFEAGTIHRPKPKGGEDRAFTIPLSRFVLDLLRERREENRVLFGDDKGWVFPSHNSAGLVTHVQELKEQRTRKKVSILPTPHRLRDTFATAAHEAQINGMDIKVLMNHALPAGDVTQGYMRPSIGHLRKSVGRITELLIEKLELRLHAERLSSSHEPMAMSIASIIASSTQSTAMRAIEKLG